MWANAAAAYANLSAPLKAFAKSLRAVHSNAYDYAAVKPEASSNQIRRYREVFASTVYETEHPVVHIHPETGEKALLLGGFVKNFVGLDRNESARVFQIFQDQITKPENTVRWRWQPGDVAIWDNRATQHRAIADFSKQSRHLRRATIAGTIPTAVDGSRSRVLQSSPDLAAA